jgi:hypothetical protein
MHGRYDSGTKRFSRMAHLAATAIADRQDGAAGAPGYALGFILVFAAAAFVLAHHFLAH